jgi:hypothetical protein
MTEARIEIRMSNEEKKQLRVEADKCDYSLSDYIRKKLLDDNADIYTINKTKFISPSGAAHEAIVAASVKTIECVLLEIIKKMPNTTKKEAFDILRRAREAAKNGLKNYGYHIIKPENN